MTPPPHPFNRTHTHTQVVQMRDDISTAKKSLEELESAGGSGALGGEGDESEQAKYELLVKRDQDMTAFMDAFPDTRNGTTSVNN